jgi:hypothetical protein
MLFYAHLLLKPIFISSDFFMDIKLYETYSTVSKSSLTLMHQNIRGLLSKNDELVTNQIKSHLSLTGPFFLSKQT